MSEEHSETLSDHLQRIRKLEEEARAKHDSETVSYTHLTLPTILLV